MFFETLVKIQADRNKILVESIRRLLRLGATTSAVAVCMAVIRSMSVAALVGSLVPMRFARINIDPAVATVPFVATAVDIISVFFYFTIATTFLGI